MGLVSAHALINAICDGTLDGAGLEAALTTGGRLGDFQSVLTQRGQCRRLAGVDAAMTAVAASPTAMAAVAASSTAMRAVLASSVAMTAMLASSTAMTAVAASSTAMTAVIASSTAMAAVIASSTAMAAVIASSTAMAAAMDAPAGRLAMWESDTALTALYDYPDTVAALCTHSQTTRGGAGSGSHTFEPRGTKVILLRRWYSGNEYDRFRWTRTGGDLPGYGTWAKRRDGANNPTSDDSQADFVYACDGLQRTGSNNNRTLYVRYIRV